MTTEKLKLPSTIQKLKQLVSREEGLWSIDYEAKKSEKVCLDEREKKQMSDISLHTGHDTNNNVEKRQSQKEKNSGNKLTDGSGRSRLNRTLSRIGNTKSINVIMCLKRTTKTGAQSSRSLDTTTKRDVKYEGECNEHEYKNTNTT